MWLKKWSQAWFPLLGEWESLQILKELIINKIRKRVQLVALKVTLSKRVPLTVQTEPLRTVQLQPDNPAQPTLQQDPWQEETSSNCQGKPIHLKMTESSLFRVQLSSRIFWWLTPKPHPRQEVAAWILFSLSRYLRLSLADRLWQNPQAFRIGRGLSRHTVGL